MSREEKKVRNHRLIMYIIPMYLIISSFALLENFQVPEKAIRKIVEE